MPADSARAARAPRAKRLHFPEGAGPRRTHAAHSASRFRPRLVTLAGDVTKGVVFRRPHARRAAQSMIRPGHPNSARMSVYVMFITFVQYWP
jgi:hypothetical protein